MCVVSGLGDCVPRVFTEAGAAAHQPLLTLLLPKETALDTLGNHLRVSAQTPAPCTCTPHPVMCAVWSCGLCTVYVCQCVVCIVYVCQRTASFSVHWFVLWLYIYGALARVLVVVYNTHADTTHTCMLLGPLPNAPMQPMHSCHRVGDG